MDTGIVTIIVAAVFSALGLVGGFFIGKMSCAEKEGEKVEKNLVAISENSLKNDALKDIEQEISDLKISIKSLVESILDSNKTVVEAYEEKIKKIFGDLDKVIKKMVDSDVVKDSKDEMKELYEELKKAFEEKKKTQDLSTILEKVKDKLDIVRTELEAVKLKMGEALSRKNEKADINVDFSKLEKIAEFAKEINEEAIKGSLINLIYSFKDFEDKDRKELLKATDTIALNSKQIVLLVEDFKKTLAEERK